MHRVSLLEARASEAPVVRARTQGGGRAARGRAHREPAQAQHVRGARSTRGVERQARAQHGDAVVRERVAAAGQRVPREPERARAVGALGLCLLYTSPSPRDGLLSRMPSSA